MEKKEKIRVEISIALEVDRETDLKVLNFTSTVSYPLPQKKKKARMEKYQRWLNLSHWKLYAILPTNFCQLRMFLNKATWGKKQKR